MGVAPETHHVDPHFAIHDPGHSCIDAANPLIGFGVLNESDCLRQRLHFEDSRMLEYCARDDERQRQFIKYLWTQYFDRFPGEGMASLNIDHFDIDDQVRAYTWDGTVVPITETSSEGIAMPEKSLHLLLGDQKSVPDMAKRTSRSEKGHDKDREHRKHRSKRESAKDKKASLLGWILEGEKKSSKSKHHTDKKSSRSKHDGDKKSTRSKHERQTTNEHLARPSLDEGTEDEREVAMRSVTYTLKSPPGTDPDVSFKVSEWAVPLVPDSRAGPWGSSHPAHQSTERSTWFHDLAGRAYLERMREQEPHTQLVQWDGEGGQEIGADYEEYVSYVVPNVPSVSRTSVEQKPAKSEQSSVPPVSGRPARTSEQKSKRTR